MSTRGPAGPVLEGVSGPGEKDSGWPVPELCISELPLSPSSCLSKPAPVAGDDLVPASDSGQSVDARFLPSVPESSVLCAIPFGRVSWVSLGEPFTGHFVAADSRAGRAFRPCWPAVPHVATTRGSGVSRETGAGLLGTGKPTGFSGHPVPSPPCPACASAPSSPGHPLPPAADITHPSARPPLRVRRRTRPLLTPDRRHPAQLASTPAWRSELHCHRRRFDPTAPRLHDPGIAYPEPAQNRGSVP